LRGGAGNRRRLADHVRLSIRHQDVSAFGTAVSLRIDDSVRRALRLAAEVVRRSGMASAVRMSRAILEQTFAPGGPGAVFYERPGRLRPECLYPPAGDTRPSTLVIETAAGGQASFALEGRTAGELAAWLGDWTLGAAAPTRGPAARLWRTLQDAGALCREPTAPAPPGDVVLVGHATVLVRGQGGSVLFDPLLLPTSAQYPSGYQPLSPAQLRPDAVCITHSHPDHFDLASLLRLGRDTPIYVPPVGRESILSVDMESRLAELGFRQVRPLGWGQTFEQGGVRVRALPFFGEQPTSSGVLAPEARNAGNVYLVEAQGKRFALTADAGRDRAGDVRAVAGEARRRFGPVDVLFGGYRAWAIYPIAYLWSSVARYLLFVPPEQWSVRQELMNDPDACLDTAEAWDAGLVVPYADGGAPWHWRLRLGPDLTQPGALDPHFDPPPEALVEAAARRSSWNGERLASPVPVQVLRPGEGLRATESAWSVCRSGATVWPYAGAAAADPGPAAESAPWSGSAPPARARCR
jgi:L-ascorbate metabolism protein UlaG (beta-lactamase superfamily)